MTHQNNTQPVIVETQRLKIRPLTYDQLVMYLNADNSLEQDLKVQPSNRVISPELKDALEKTIIPAVADTRKNYLFSTLWTAISKADNQMVGDLCIIGEPNMAGEIEIGYGTYEAFQNKGFMTEMVAGMIEWAKTQYDVKAILAFTEKTNISSYSVLQKNGFIKVGEKENMLSWKLIVNNNPL
jgi:[ribosomal protein S5]-alanine N-acetyltransferase